MNDVLFGSIGTSHSLVYCGQAGAEQRQDIVANRVLTTTCVPHVCCNMMKYTHTNIDVFFQLNK